MVFSFETFGLDETSWSGSCAWITLAQTADCTLKTHLALSRPLTSLPPHFDTPKRGHKHFDRADPEDPFETSAFIAQDCQVSGTF